MDPKLFKRLARAYITGTDISNVELSDTTKNLANTIYSIEKIEKKYAISSSDTVGSALLKTTQASTLATPVPKPAEAFTEAQTMEKIRKYDLIVGNVSLNKYMNRNLSKDDSGEYTLTQETTDVV